MQNWKILSLYNQDSSHIAKQTGCCYLYVHKIRHPDDFNLLQCTYDTVTHTRDESISNDFNAKIVHSHKNCLFGRVGPE